MHHMCRKRGWAFNVVTELHVLSFTLHELFGILIVERPWWLELEINGEELGGSVKAYSQTMYYSPIMQLAALRAAVYKSLNSGMDPLDQLTHAADSFYTNPREMSVCPQQGIG